MGEIREFGHARLHAEGHLKLIDAVARFRILITIQCEVIQLREFIEHRTPAGAGDAGWIGEKQHRILAGTETHALNAFNK